MFHFIKAFIFLLSFASLVGVDKKFEFISYKDSSGHLSKNFIHHLVKEFGVDVFFETGTYMGTQPLTPHDSFGKFIQLKFILIFLMKQIKNFMIFLI